MGLRVANAAAVPGPRPMARGRVGASLDYGAASIAALQASIAPIPRTDFLLARAKAWASFHPDRQRSHEQ